MYWCVEGLSRVISRGVKLQSRVRDVAIVRKDKRRYRKHVTHNKGYWDIAAKKNRVITELLEQLI